MKGLPALLLLAPCLSKLQGSSDKASTSRYLTCTSPAEAYALGLTAHWERCITILLDSDIARHESRETVPMILQSASAQPRSQKQDSKERRRKQQASGQAPLGVKRTHAWFVGFGELRIRFKRRLDVHRALLMLAAAIIYSRFVKRAC